jgi:heme a synthase
MNDPQPSMARLWQPALTCGFASAVVLWVGWFVTHLPWAGVPEPAAITTLAVLWFLSSIGTGMACGRDGWRVGPLAGGVAALLGLLVLGSRVRPEPGAQGVPGPGLIVVGFMLTGVVLGLIGGASGGALRRGADCRAANWLGRFALVTTIAVAPLAFIGGLVTSTNSGLAVPDWPNTFGSNMFLYPLGPRVEPAIFLEHSHRLFGALAGVAVVTLTAWRCLAGATPTLRRGFGAAAITGAVACGVLLAAPRVPANVELAFAAALSGVVAAMVLYARLDTPPLRRERLWALGILALIIVQGYLGGARVVEQARGLALVHGVTAQVILGALAMLAVRHARAWHDAASLPPIEASRRLRALATGAMHSLLVQLVLGAAYRHFPHAHVLWTHVVFALVVSIMAMLAGFAAGGLPEDVRDRPAVRAARRVGVAVAVVVAVQFMLGWAAFFAGGDPRTTDTPAQALVRTAHQANGALLVGLVSALLVLARAIHRSAAGRGAPAGRGPGETPVE